MTKIVKLMKALSDPTRVRILMLLGERELCVCQIMGVLRVSQPLVSKNLNLLDAAGFLRGRKEGKLVFYSLDAAMPATNKKAIDLIKEALRGDSVLAADIGSLRDCEEFQKKTGRCDMKTFSEFMKAKRARRPRK